MTLPCISRSLIGSVRRNMNTQGFALVDTYHFLKDKEWPSQRSKDFKKLNFNASASRGCYISLGECSTNWIKRLIKWQELLLQKALPEENIRSRYDGLSLRNERFKISDVSRWHSDGAYIRSLCVVKGPTTTIMTDLGESHIPLGWTLFITAKDRYSSKKISATLHRRPRTKKLRRLIVYGWDGQ